MLYFGGKAQFPLKGPKNIGVEGANLRDSVFTPLKTAPNNPATIKVGKLPQSKILAHAARARFASAIKAN